MLKNIFVVAVALILPMQGRANDLHLNLPAKTREVLAPKANALTLVEVQNRLVNDQIDLQISYEKLFEAHKKIGVARAQYFPYGVGTVAMMYFMNVVNPVWIIELFTSLPSKIYHVQSEKNMYMAQYHSNEALKLNIKNQVAQLYYNILKEEAALKFAQMELTLMGTLLKVTEDRVATGLSTEQELEGLRLRILDLRDICVKFAAYLSEEKYAFNTMIAKTPEEARKIELQPESKFINADDFGLSSEILKLNAIDRSSELKAADYMVTAAAKSRHATQWSILSFSGIGFGYWGRVQVATSRVEQAKANRDLTEVTIANQAYMMNTNFHRLLDHFDSEVISFNDTATFYESEFERFRVNNIALDRLLEAEIMYLKDYRELVAAHYDAVKKMHDLERLTAGSARGKASDANKFEVVFNNVEDNKYTLSIRSNETIKSVEYVFSDAGLSPMNLINSTNGYLVTLKLAQRGVAGHVNVTLANGKTITKLFDF